MSETWIGKHPRDGREYDCQCARCGSSLAFEPCDSCGGEGYVEGDCFEDTCCCLGEHDYVACDQCLGKGSFPSCMSSPDWCQSHPREGREHISSGTPEWFCIERGG